MSKEIIRKEMTTSITKEDIKKYFCADATDKELELALQICKLNNLNPFKREAHIVKYKEGEPIQILTGYETYLKRAERSGNYGGFKVWTEGQGNDMVAKIEVYRKDWKNPLCHEVEYTEYVQTKWDKYSRKRIPNRFWATKPKTMLKKVVISQGLRYAFPDELAGIPYTLEEYNGEYEKEESLQESLQEPQPKKKTAKQPKPQTSPKDNFAEETSAEMFPGQPQKEPSEEPEDPIGNKDLFMVDTVVNSEPGIIKPADLKKAFTVMRKALGEEGFQESLEIYSLKKLSDIKKPSTARMVLATMLGKARNIDE